MLKKLGLILSVIVIIIGISWWSISSPGRNNNACAFCDPIIVQNQTFYQDNFVTCLCTHKPVQEYHCLIVTKRHIERFEQATEEEITAIGRAIKKIDRAVQKINGPSSYILLQKNGHDVGQTVPHVHVHYIPKKISNNKLAPYNFLWSFIVSLFKQPIEQEQLAINVKDMRQAVTQQTF